MANQHPMRAERRDDTDPDRVGAERVATREAMRISRQEDAQKRRLGQRSGTSKIYVGLIVILIAILSVVALWLQN